jgi:hypothetical protein
MPDFHIPFLRQIAQVAANLPPLSHPEMPKKPTKKQANGEQQSLEQKLWQAPDALRNNRDAADNKYVVLGMISVKRIYGAFEDKHARLAAQKSRGAAPEAPDEYRTARVLLVPTSVRLQYGFSSTNHQGLCCFGRVGGHTPKMGSVA